MDNQERNREALIEHIAEQDRIIRRRNEQIDRQVERIEEAEGELTKYRAMHSEQIKTIARLQESPRPLTADDITREMVERGRAYMESQAWTVGGLLRAALTEPTRPEGAEEIEAMVEESLSGDALSDAQVQALADFLAKRGVRVTGGN